jgi:hypothetical protein
MLMRRRLIVFQKWHHIEYLLTASHRGYWWCSTEVERLGCFHLTCFTLANRLEPVFTATSQMPAYVYLLAVLQETKLTSACAVAPSIQYPQRQKPSNTSELCLISHVDATRLE